MTTRIAIIGGRGTGHIILQAIRDLARAGADVACIGFLKDIMRSDETIDGASVLGPFDAWREQPPDTRFITAILRPKQMRARRRRIEGLEIPEDRFVRVVHPTATIAETAEIGVGTYIGPNVAVLPEARIGRHCSIRANACISHDVVIGDFAFVGPNASLNGGSKLGDGAHLGSNGTLADGITVGDYALVGIGSAAARDVEPGTIVLGVPARFAGRIDEEDA